MQGPGLSPIKSPINSNKYLSKQKSVSSLSDLRKLSPKS